MPPETATFPVPDSSTRCYCLSGDTYVDCCGRFHLTDATAPTAERLMRSRYSAFVVGNTDYLLATYHPSTRPKYLELDPGQRWYRLDILGRTGGSLTDTVGTVEFIARYRFGPDRGEQRENSRFERVGREWRYVAAG